MFKDRIKELRTIAGLTMDDFAESIDMAGRVISDFEAGKSKPSNKTLEKIAKAYHVSKEWLKGAEIKETVEMLKSAVEIAAPVVAEEVLEQGLKAMDAEAEAMKDAEKKIDDLFEDKITVEDLKEEAEKKAAPDSKEQAEPEETAPAPEEQAVTVAEEIMEAAEEIAEPAEVIAEAAEEIAEPIEEIAEAAEEIAEPAEVIAEAAEEIAEPAEVIVEAAEEIAEPAEEIAEAAEEIAEPIEEIAEAAETIAEPVEEIAVPAEEIAEQIPEEKAPKPKKQAKKKSAPKKKTAAKKETASEKAEVKSAPEKKAKKAKKKPAAPQILTESLTGDQITLEEIKKKAPAGVDRIYVKPEENKAFWVKGDEHGDVDLW